MLLTGSWRVRICNCPPATHHARPKLLLPPDRPPTYPHYEDRHSRVEQACKSESWTRRQKRRDKPCCARSVTSLYPTSRVCTSWSLCTHLESHANTLGPETQPEESIGSFPSLGLSDDGYHVYRLRPPKPKTSPWPHLAPAKHLRRPISPAATTRAPRTQRLALRPESRNTRLYIRYRSGSMRDNRVNTIRCSHPALSLSYSVVHGSHTTRRTLFQYLRC
jgi:hypothetical protein